MKIHRDKPVQLRAKLLIGIVIGLVLAAIIVTAAFWELSKLGATWVHTSVFLAIACVITVAIAIVKSGRDNFDRR